MPILLLLQILVEADGGWHVGVGPYGTHLQEGRIESARVRAMLDEVARCLNPDDHSPLLMAGDDAAVTSGEERAGRVLAAVLSCSDAVIRAVAEQRGASRATDRRLVIVLAARDEQVRDLPWECLAIDPEEGPLECSGGGLVVRLGSGRGLPASATLQPVLWSADDEDPAVIELVGDVEFACRKAGLPAPIRPGSETGTARGPGLVFLIGHGESVDQHLRVLSEDRPIASSSLTHALQPWLSDAVLVVVLICEGGKRPHGLVDRILAAGASAVLASEVRLAVEAGTVMIRELVPALARGDSLALAVAAGRRAVRALAWPFPDSRWWRLGLNIGHVDAVAWAGPRHRLPQGWSPGPEASRVLSQAMEHAARRRQRWLGVEHLVLALREGPSPVRREIRLAARHWSGKLGDYLDQFEVTPDASLRLSPRLARVRDAMPAGFHLNDLVEAVLCSLPPWFLRRLGLPPYRDDGSTYPFEFNLDGNDNGDLDASVASPFESEGDTAASDDCEAVEREPFVALEVLGGPEDGRRLHPRPGQELGRATSSAQADHALYQETSAVDPFLSRRHIRFDGEGRVQLLRPAYRMVPDPGARPRGEIHLYSGDLLALTPLTWLLALGPDEEHEGPLRRR